jgi:hypothetical protein
MVRVNGAPVGGGTEPSRATGSSAAAATPPPVATTSGASAPAHVAPAAPQAKVEPTPAEKGRKLFEDDARTIATGQHAYVAFLQGDYDLLAYQAQLQKEGTPVDDALVADLVEKQRVRVQDAIKGGAENHRGWEGTVPAPADAAKVATDQVRNHPYLRARDHFHFIAVQVLGDTWQIERSRAGIPLAQFKRVKVVARRDGVEGCVAFDATINHANMGGSTYASAWGSVATLSDWSGVKCPPGAH